MHTGQAIRFRRSRLRDWGLSVPQALIGLAIIVLAAGIFLPALRVQWEAAKLAFRQPDPGTIAPQAALTLEESELNAAYRDRLESGWGEPGSRGTGGENWQVR